MNDQHSGNWPETVGGVYMGGPQKNNYCFFLEHAAPKFRNTSHQTCWTDGPSRVQGAEILPMKGGGSENP